MGHGRHHDPVQHLNDDHAGDLVAMARALGGHPEAPPHGPNASTATASISCSTHPAAPLPRASASPKRSPTTPRTATGRVHGI